MPDYLCVSVTFLDPLFHGRGDHAPEWPPSPMRLFQALLAAAHAGCRSAAWSDARAAAFRWLERQPPPLIVAPRAHLSRRCTYFLPNNDSDKIPQRQDRLTSKVAQPHRLMGGQTVHYLWALESDTGGAAASAVETLRADARGLLALGWGLDQVAGCCRVMKDNEAAQLPGQRWRPWRTHLSGQQPWRIPMDGTLGDLEECHQSFTVRIRGLRYTPPREPSRFNKVYYLRDTFLPPRAYAVFELRKGEAFRAADTAIAAAMLRSLACRRAQKDTHTFPGGSETYVAGHVDVQEKTSHRFSYLPLPTIGHEYADGMIRRLVVVEPFGSDGAQARWAERRLRGAILRDREERDCGVLLDLWRSSSRRILDKYVGENRSWSTVTPVVLPGFDDGKQIKAEKLVLKAAARAGLASGVIEHLALRKAPFWPGSQHAHHYFAPEYLAQFPRWHVWMQLRKPIAGPLAIGAGRHVGLGLFAVTDVVSSIAPESHSHTAACPCPPSTSAFR